MKAFLARIKLLGILYPVYLLVEIIFQGLRLFGRIKIVPPLHQVSQLENIILVSNHPSFLEPVLVPLTFFSKYVFHPIHYLPWNVPEKSHFYDPWFFWWIRSRSIPIDRHNRSLATNKKTLQKMRWVLQNKQSLILFAEGGITSHGTEFRYSQKGKRLRKLQKGVAWLVQQSGARIIPIWIDGSEKVLSIHQSLLPRFWKARIIIKIGSPLSFSPSSPTEVILEKITLALLELADQ